MSLTPALTFLDRAAAMDRPPIVSIHAAYIRITHAIGDLSFQASIADFERALAPDMDMYLQAIAADCLTAAQLWPNVYFRELVENEVTRSTLAPQLFQNFEDAAGHILEARDDFWNEAKDITCPPAMICRKLAKLCAITYRAYLDLVPGRQ